MNFSKSKCRIKWCDKPPHQYTPYCIRHACPIQKCTNYRTCELHICQSTLCYEPRRNNRSSFCISHSCPDESCDSHVSICFKHRCKIDSCNNTIDYPSLFCMFHRCGTPKCLNGSAEGLGAHNQCDQCYWTNLLRRMGKTLIDYKIPIFTILTVCAIAGFIGME
jgi:hypothetical protein